jgi:hypothetical protein
VVARLAGLVALLMAGSSAVAIAQTAPTTSGPAITTAQTTVKVGEQIDFTVSGFKGRGFVLSVCGNEARRGSSDCDMVGSRSLPVDVANGGVTGNQMQVGAPPVPCPCVLRASSITNDEIAVTPLVIEGHPVAEVVDGGAVRDPLVVTVQATPSPNGLGDSFRATLGGPARYAVTITVRNRSVVPASNVTLSAAGGRSADDFRVLVEPDDPGLIPAGQTWQQTVEAVVPYPSFGTMQWRATASGAGVPVTATTSTSSKPTLLILLAVFLIVDLFILLARFTIRRRLARDAEREGAEQATGDAAEPDAVDDRQPVGV